MSIQIKELDPEIRKEELSSKWDWLEIVLVQQRLIRVNWIRLKSIKSQWDTSYVWGSIMGKSGSDSIFSIWVLFRWYLGIFAGNTKGASITVTLSSWFGISSMATDKFSFYFQTSQTGGQWYSDTSPIVFPVVLCYFFYGLNALKNVSVQNIVLLSNCSICILKFQFEHR